MWMSRSRDITPSSPAGIWSVRKRVVLCQEFPAVRPKLTRLPAAKALREAKLPRASTSEGRGPSSSSQTTTVTQIGPVTPNLDPTIQQTGVWQHSTAPQPSALVSRTDSLISNSRIYGTSSTDGLLTGRNSHAELHRIVPQPKYPDGLTEPFGSAESDSILPTQSAAGIRSGGQCPNHQHQQNRPQDLRPQFQDHRDLYRGRRPESVLWSGCRLRRPARQKDRPGRGREVL